MSGSNGGLRTLLAAVVVGLLMQTPVAAASQPTLPPNFGTPHEYVPLRASKAPVSITLSSAPQALNVGQQRHSAFPGMTQLPDGTVHLVWREADHHNVGNGVIMRAVSRDGGRTFGHIALLRADEENRDPSISVPQLGNVAYLTWFTASGSAPARGAFAMREFGATYRMDPGLPYAAVSAPVVRLPNGQLGGVFYGRQAGETIDTVWMAWSYDGGPWTSNRIANAIGAGVHYNEPYMVVDGAAVHVFFRDGGNGIAMRSSTNSGATGSWDAPRRILSDATGRPSTFRTAAGSLVMVYRQASTGAARLAYSLDHGVSWTDGGVVMPSIGGLGMTYATFFEPIGEPGKIRGVVGREGRSSATSQLYGFELVEG